MEIDREILERERRSRRKTGSVARICSITVLERRRKKLDLVHKPPHGQNTGTD